MKRPAFQFYPADWRKDVELRSCSLAARGLWIDILCIAHECEPYGHLTINGKAMNVAQIAGQVGLTKQQCSTLLQELVDNGVARSNGEGVIYSKRMVDDERLRNIRAEAGKLGGNPALLVGKVNQKATTEVNQTTTPSSSSSSSSSSSKESRRGSRLPQGWKPDEDLERFAREQQVNPDAELAKFRDYWAAQPGQRGVKLDWPATWRNWCRNAKKNPADVARITVPGPKPSSFLAEQAAHRAAVEAERIARIERQRQAA